ncbi:hypothetical protein BDQ17DRAFT_849982 [Cyathus striatus]|nr:hypothetical protein BDQ17DRAFT_849982 [Cyathus striatus]
MLDIPEDIAELIVNEASVSDDGTSCIKSCALISKKFLAPSRKHLFRKVQLKDIVQYARFQSAVASSPSIATHVHEFSTEDPSIIDDPAFPALLGSFLNIMKLDLCFDHLHIPVYSGPGSTPGTVPPRIYWQNLELVLQDVLDCILRAPILERLAIRGICDIPQRYIMSFLDIPFLTLDNSSFAAQNPDIGLTPKASGNYRLQNLTLSHIQIAELQPFIKILSLIKFRLETLHVLRVDLEIAQKIIDIQRSSIVHLDIDRLLNGSG